MPFLILHSPHILSSSALCCCQIKAQHGPRRHGGPHNPVCGHFGHFTGGSRSDFRSYTVFLGLFSYSRFSCNVTFIFSIHAFQPSDLSPSALFALSVHAAGGAARRQTACYTLVSDTIRLLILASESPRGARVSPRSSSTASSTASLQELRLKLTAHLLDNSDGQH